MTQPTNKFPYVRYRYHCSCQKVSHVTYRPWEELPPETCPAGQPLVRDFTYEDTEMRERLKQINGK